MSEELIVKVKTEMLQDTLKRDVLSLYGVPMLDKIVEKERKNLLSHLCCEVGLFSFLKDISDSDKFIVEIPSHLREMLKSGQAVFDKSSKISGAYTPNIRISGESGIKGQAYIVKESNIMPSLSNLVMMAMLQNVIEKLEVIEEKIENVIQGQKNDRIGLIIGHFKGFMDLYPSFKTEEERNNAANLAYSNMQEGLAKLHLQIEEEQKELNDAPSNHFDTILKALFAFTKNEAEYYQKCYKNYIWDIQLYNRLILLSDIILCLKGNDELISKNHEKMIAYCTQCIDDDFIKKMDYLTNHSAEEICNIIEYNKSLEVTLNECKVQNIKIECTKDDVKYLNFE